MRRVTRIIYHAFNNCKKFRLLDQQKVSHPIPVIILVRFNFQQDTLKQNIWIEQIDLNCVEECRIDRKCYQEIRENFKEFN